MITWAEIDLQAISHNLREIRARAQENGAGVIAVVKDNAYGHGAVEVAKAAAEIPVDMLAVATVEEAIELREAGIALPILIITAILPEQAAEVVRYDITQTITRYEVGVALSAAAEKQGKRAVAHVKVDTGMGRVGIQYDSAVQIIEKLVRLPFLKISGILTHFAVAESDPDFTQLQVNRFRAVNQDLASAGIHVPIKHLANSAAVLQFPEYCFDMVRPGLIVYGIYPSRTSRSLDLRPALTMKTRIFHIKALPAGRSVSYGRTYITQGNTIVASLAAGYGHGYNRRLSNSGEVIVRGRRAPIVGTVCMDQCLCDVTHIPNVRVGDEVVLIGRQGNEEITIDEIARKAGTISYEILCNINARVPRIYGDSSQPA